MAFRSDPRSMSDHALGRMLVMVVCRVGAGACGIVALGAGHGGVKYLMALGAGAFLLSALLPTIVAPRFGQVLLLAVGAMTFMGVGGGVKADVTLTDWLVILPFLLFALLLSFPGGVVSLIRWMTGSGR